MKISKTRQRFRAFRHRRDLYLEHLEPRCLLAGDIGLGIVHGQLKIANGTAGLPVGSPSVFESFGSSIASLGDIDGDNIEDLAVGAPRIQGGVYVLRMNAAGGVKASVKITDGHGGLPPGTLSEYDYFGMSVAAVDLDRDGIRELIVGASGDDTHGDATGAVYVLSLNADGSVKSTRKIANGSAGLRANALGETDRFGTSLASIGDFDGDGIEDLAVGATDTDGNPTDNDAVHLVMLNRDGTVKSKIAIDKTSPGLAGLSDMDNFGISVTALGDLDGNHVIDFAVGASTDDTGGPNRGAVYLLMMNANGTPRIVQKIADGSGLPAGTLRNGDAFGHSVALIGDLDGDGLRELAVGALEDTTDGVRRGAVYLLSLNADGTVKSSRKIAHQPGGLQPEMANHNLHFGSSLAWLGNIGAGDTSILAAGGAYDDTGKESAGAVYLFNLAPTTWTPPAPPNDNPDTHDGDDHEGVGDDNQESGQDSGGSGDHSECNGDSSDGSDAGEESTGSDKPIWVHSFTKIAHQTGGFGALNTNDNFAAAVASLGDLDGDGNVDVVVGAPHDDPYKQDPNDDQGAAYVLFLKQDGTVRESRKITDRSGGLALSPYDHFGSSVASLGDLDRDGVIDLVVGVPGDDTGSEFKERGAVYVLFMNRDGTVKANRKIADNTGGMGTLINLGHFGSSVAGIGDLDGDGVTDLAVGAPDINAGGINKGAVYLLFLNTDGTVKTSRQIGNETSGLGELNDFGLFGTSVTSLGDLNGDQIADLGVGAPGDDTNGNFSGAVYVLFLNRDGSVQTSRKLTGQSAAPIGPGPNSSFGTSVASPGDLNGDGVLDLLVGARGETYGALYALLMTANGTVQTWGRVGRETAGFGPLRLSDGFGTSVAALGDLDRDGMLDLAVGAALDDADRNCPDGTWDCRFENRGALYLLNLVPTGWNPTATPPENPDTQSGVESDCTDEVIDDDSGGNADDTVGNDDSQDGSDEETSDDNVSNEDNSDVPVNDGECGEGTEITCDLSEEALEVDATGDTQSNEDDVDIIGDTSECDGIHGLINCDVSEESIDEDTSEHSESNEEDVVETGDHSETTIKEGITDTSEGIGDGDGSEDNRIFAVLELNYAWLTAETNDSGTAAYGLHLGGGGQHVDLTDVDADELPNIEMFDIRGEGNNALSLTVRDVENISASHTLSLHADAGDTVQIGSGWSFRGTEIDGGSFIRIFAQNEALLRMAGPYDWSNPANPLDVNGNGAIEPRDALNVINALNSRDFVQANGALVDAASLLEFPGFLLDAQPDGFLVPRDALRIINYLNEDSHSTSLAEGEGGLEDDLIAANMLVIPQAFDLAILQLADSMTEPIACGRPRQSELYPRSQSFAQARPSATFRQAEFLFGRARSNCHAHLSLRAYATVVDELCAAFEQRAEPTYGGSTTET